MSLKSYIRSHIKEKMIAETMSSFADGITSFLLILDQESSQILSSYLTMSELINLELFSVELITKKRQPYKAMHAIYFLSPKSCDLIEKDFIGEDGKPFNLYKRAHLFFTEKLTDYELNKLLKPELVKRIVTLKEANAGFFMADKNIFYLESYSYFVDKAANESLFSYFFIRENNIIDEKIKTFCEKISSSCIIANQFPNIAYYKGDKICKRIAIQVNNEIANYYKTNDNSPNKNSLMLITSRILDICGPLLYDMSYSTLLYDNLKKKGTNVVTLQGKNYTLDDNDILYSRYKNEEISEALKKIPEEFDKFNEKATKLQKKEMDTFEEMGEVVRGYADIQRSKSQFVEHINLLTEIRDRIKEMSINEIMDIQNSIISGISESGSNLKYKDIVKNMRKLANKVDNDCIIRLLSCMNYYLNLSKENLQSAIESANDYFNDISLSQEKIIGFFSKQNAISQDEMDALDKQILLYRTKSMDNKKLEKDNRFLCVKECKLATLVDMFANSVLPQNHFEYLQEPTAKKKKKAKKINFGGMGTSTKDNSSKELLYLFNFGCISHYEIASIEKMAQDLDYQVIIGSNAILNAKEYLHQVDLFANGKEKIIPINKGNANISIESDSKLGKDKGEMDLIDKSG
ncbi:MAG: Sec1 family protein [archaeon]|nr:Sec1 family protein [archaeon]